MIMETVSSCKDLSQIFSTVHTFWEDHKILRNLHRRFDLNYTGKSTVKILQKFVAFSKYMNFKDFANFFTSGNLEMSFWYLQLSQNRTKKFYYTTMVPQVECFRSFLGTFIYIVTIG